MITILHFQDLQVNPPLCDRLIQSEQGQDTPTQKGKKSKLKDERQNVSNPKFQAKCSQVIFKYKDSPISPPQKQLLDHLHVLHQQVWPPLRKHQVQP